VSKRLLIYVEGQTEEFFVNRVLRNHLLAHGVKVERPILAATTPDPGGQRGGFVNWPAVERDLQTLFTQDADPNLRITTLLDTYALPDTVPGFSPSSGVGRSATEVNGIESAWAAHFGEPRFVPYFQRHEFEALLLACPVALRSIFPTDAAALTQLAFSIASYGSAEDINDGPATHPSARLEQAIPTYHPLKASHGLFVILEAGLDRIRPQCPRFDAWLARWETWGGSQ
jgi:hypothetical protein